MSESIYLGIDTGGTFTDGVLLNPVTRQVIKKAKVLTTHHDLKICINGILDCLVTENPEVISLVSLSTTLATNAIAEGKSLPVALMLMGYDAELVHKFNFHQEFGTNRYFFIRGKHDMNGYEIVPLDEKALEQQVKAIQGDVAAFALSSYAGTLNSDHEGRAAAKVARMTKKPVVQGHHLSDNLDSILRATTASLNASLLTTAYEFMEVVQEMLSLRGIRAPLIVVRGDGTLVSADFAAQRPVEIIHSGPATSAIGGRFLANLDTALVIDIGGTTTDIALIENGMMKVHEGETTVGSYRTCVSTVNTRSFGLGGDSLIRFDHTQEMSIGPERAIPYAYLGYQYPEAKRELLTYLAATPYVRYSDRLEFWIFRRDPLQPFSDLRTQKVIERLKKNPERLPRLLKSVGAIAPVQVDGAQLIAQEVIDRSALTPTDLLHITGEFTPWDAGFSRDIVAAICRMWEIDLDTFIQRARDLITRRIISEIVQFLSGKFLREPTLDFKNVDIGNWLLDESLVQKNPYLGCKLMLKLPIVGIGAPAKAFLKPVAEALGTEIVFPEHYEVANAVGTVVGNIMVRKEAEVFPCVEGSVQVGYFARTDGLQKRFGYQDEALEFARSTLRNQVAAGAKAAGAEAPEVKIEEHEGIPGFFYLSAMAVGKPKIRA